MSFSKFKMILLSVLACMVLLTSACQATPEAHAVVNKANDSLEELVLQKADPAWAQSEDTIVWNKTKTVNTELGECTVDVSINAKIPKLPGKVPVYIIEPKRFDVMFFKKAAESLMVGDIYEATSSKQDMMKEILSFKKEISAHTIIDQESVERELEFLNKCYEEAADSDTNFIFDCQDTRGCYNLKSYPDNDSIMNFCGSASFFSFGRYELNRGFGFATNQTGEGVQAAGTKMTYEQACDKADEMMQTLFDVPFAIVNAKLISKINEWEFLWHDGRDTSLGEAYVFYYTREYDGIPSLYIEPAFKIVDDGTEFRRPFPREGACIMVDDRGIINVTYQSFSHTVEKLNDNVKLMAFEDVLERFKRDIFNHRLWGVEKAEIDITRIEFGMVREPIKDKAEQYMMVPAWNFIGNINNGRFLEQDKSVLALSALNGSVITDYDFIF